MAEKGLYGEVTAIHELAHGIYQLTIAGYRTIYALLFDKPFAHRVLSPVALNMADEYDENHLSFPDTDGRMSIPMLEFYQQGYIKLPLHAAKQHFNNLYHKLPDYLRARGILREKPLPDLHSKMETEALRFEKRMSARRKKDIIKSAREILEFNKIKEILGSNEFPLRNQGLLASLEAPVSEVRSLLKEKEMTISPENVISVCNELYKTIELRGDELTDIRRELQRTGYTGAKTVIVQFKAGDTATEFAMPTEDFERLLYTDELKAAFAKRNMLDFPSSDYYGEKNSLLFDALFLKRFGEDLIDNWNKYAPQGENVSLTVKGLSTELVPYDSYSELRHMLNLKEYFDAAYSESRTFYNRLTIEKNLEEMKKTIEETEELLKASEPQQEEVAETETKEIVNDAPPAAEAVPPAANSSAELLERAHIIDAQGAIRLSDRMINDRLANPNVDRLMYIVNKETPNEVIRLHTRYNKYVEQAEIRIESYNVDAPDVRASTVNLDRESLNDYISRLTSPVVMTEADYTNFRGRQFIEQAALYEEDVKPMAQSEELSGSQIDNIISGMEIKNVPADASVFASASAAAADLMPPIEEIEEMEVEI